MDIGTEIQQRIEDIVTSGRGYAQTTERKPNLAGPLDYFRLQEALYEMDLRDSKFLSFYERFECRMALSGICLACCKAEDMRSRGGPNASYLVTD